MNLLTLIHRIPARILYPGGVLLLLCGSCGAQAVLVTSALSGQGLQVEENYYFKALHVEENSAQAAQFERLGWKLRVEVERAPVITIHVIDEAGQPVPDLLDVVVRMHRPQLAAPVASFKLIKPQGSAPGTFGFTSPEAHAGLWDLHFTFHTASDEVLQTKVRSQW